MTDDDLTIEMEASPKWWVQPLLWLAKVGACFGLVDDERADDLAVFIGRHGFNIRVAR